MATQRYGGAVWPNYLCLCCRLLLRTIAGARARFGYLKHLSAYSTVSMEFQMRPRTVMVCHTARRRRQKGVRDGHDVLRFLVNFRRARRVNTRTHSSQWWHKAPLVATTDGGDDMAARPFHWPARPAIYQARPSRISRRRRRRHHAITLGAASSRKNSQSSGHAARGWCG